MADMREVGLEQGCTGEQPKAKGKEKSMVRGRPGRPVAGALRRSSNLILWFRTECRKRAGMSGEDEQIINRFLALNQNDLERIDTSELAAMQCLSNGEINRDLQGRCNRLSMRAGLKRKARTSQLRAIQGESETQSVREPSESMIAPQGPGVNGAAAK